MYTLKTEHSFDAAHFLYGYEESAATYTDTAGESFLRFQERSLQMKVR